MMLLVEMFSLFKCLLLVKIFWFMLSESVMLEAENVKTKELVSV